MKITVKKLADLKLSDKNIRKHTEKQLTEYVRSVKMFGQIKPIVVDDQGVILAGNGLYAAMQRAGLEECDCYVMKGLSEKQKKKLMLADNRVFELGITDSSVFEEIVKELEGDIDIPGWDADLLEMLNSSVSEATEMLESYGSYTSDEVANISRREREDHTEYEGARSQEPNPAGNGSNVHDLPEDARNTTTDGNNGNVVSPEPAQRFVVCPKCGERICL